MKEKIMKELVAKVREKLSNVYDPAGGWNHRADHCIRVMNILESFLKRHKMKKINRQAVLIGGLLHDIGVAKIIKETGSNVNSWEIDRDKHLTYGAEIARQMLKNKISEETLELVEKIIKEHHKPNPKNIETMLVKDADHLDELGYMGVWRTITYCVYNKLSLGDMIKYWRKVGIKKQKKSLKLFHFKEFRKIAKRRIKKFENFIEEIDKERLGKDF